ncbi:MAG: hypothetical protein DDG60_01870 [Anaerolineae bacterium]|nr:MAG: hypothetical protein DDG60_01870 [Anaerolineae bacterium]
MEYFLPTLGSLLTQAPVLLTWIIGIVLAIIFWRKHPAVSGLTLLAISGFLILDIVNAYLNIRLPSLLLEQGVSPSNSMPIFIFRGVISSIINAVLWILLLFSIFGWRRKDKAKVDEN